MADRDAAGFYGELAATYDEMTHFRQRLTGARRFLDRLLAQGPVQRALDVATGTGLYAIALAECGVPVSVGLDIAPEMLEAARRNAAASGVSPVWLCAPMAHIPRGAEPGYDLLLCMGNSLPHVLSDEALHAVLCEFRLVLCAGGRVVLQVLNYNAIMARQERVVSVDREGALEFVRFYDFLPDGLTLRFNVLTLDWSERTAAHQLASVLLRGWQAEELRRAMQQAGFRQVELYGGLDLRPWVAAEADTMVLTAMV